MEFSREIAVLQSALTLANQVCPGGLQHFQRSQGTRSRVLHILHDAVQEISLGLEYDFMPHESTRWQHQLASICTYLLQRHLGVTSEQLDLHYEAVSAGLPAINAELYCELVKKEGWVCNLCLLLPEMDLSAVTKVLSVLLEQVSMATASQDIDLLLGLCEYLFLHHNQILHGDHPDSDATCWDLVTKVVDLSSDVGRLGSKAGLPVTDIATKKLEILFLLCGSLHGFIHGQGRILRRTSHKLDQLRDLIYKESLHCETQKVGASGDYLLARIQDGNRTFTFRESPFTVVKFPACSARVLSHIVQRILAMSQQPLDTAALRDTLDRLWEHAQPRWVPSRLLRDEAESNFVSFWEALSSSGEMLGEADQLKEALQPLYSVVRLRVTVCSEQADCVDRRLQALHCMAELHPDWCDWLLQVGDEQVLQDSRYLACIEGNLESFTTTSRDIDYRTIRKLLQLSVQHVIVALFNKMTTVQQVGILDQMLTEAGQKSPLKVTEEFQLGMTSTFNQLVNSSDEDMEKLVRSVAVLTLQQPRLVLEKLVETAVRSTAQTRLLAQILQELSALCRLQTAQCPEQTAQCPQCPSVCQFLHNALTGEPLSRQEVANFKNFLASILQLRDSKFQPSERTRALLNPADFVRFCILPHLEWPQHSHSVSMELTLDLLVVAMETTRTLSPDWSTVMQCHMFPSMLCLCHVIDECEDLWRPGGNSSKVTLKELAVTGLHCMVEVVNGVGMQDSQEVKMAVDWLLSRLRGLHWSTAMYLSELAQTTSHSCPLLMAEEVKALLALPDGYQYKETGIDSYVCLLQLCRVSDHTCKLVMDHLVPSAFSADSQCYSKMILSLAQVLSQSTAAEWHRLAILLQQLFTMDVLYIPADTGPVIDMKPELRGATLLFQSLQLLLTSGEYTSTTQWLHLARCYTSTVKSTCVLDHGEDSNSLELQTQLLNLLCLCLHILPEGSTEPVYVLTLDLLNSCSSLAQRVRKLTNHSTSQSCVGRIGSAIGLVADASQKPNLDKVFQELVCS